MRLAPDATPLSVSTPPLSAQRAGPVDGQLLLATWLSPSFPVGAFSYSHGLETAIAGGDIGDAGDAAAWIEMLLRHGSGWCDALLLAEAWRAIRDGDDKHLGEAADLAAAMAPSHERLMETVNLGEAFLAAIASGWRNDDLDRIGSATRAIAYPVAVGAAAGAFGIPLRDTIAHFLNAFVANLASAAIRLVPFGQSEGVAIVADLQPHVLEIAERAAAATIDDLGSAAIVSDIASMRHETLFSRIFRS